MASPRNSDLQDAASHSLGVLQLSGEGPDVKPVVTSVVVPGEVEEEVKEEEQETIPEQGAAAGEGHCLGAGAPCPHKEAGEKQEGRGSEQEPGQQQQEELCLLCDVFCRLQLQEVERIFQRAQYPGVSARKETSVPESAPGARENLSDPENHSP